MEPKWISLARLAKNAERIMEDISSTGAVYLVARRGRSGVLLMDEDYFESLRFQLELATDPKLRARLEQSERDFAEGRYKTLEQVGRELGLDRPAQPTRRKSAGRTARTRSAKGVSRTRSSRRRAA